MPRYVQSANRLMTCGAAASGDLRLGVLGVIRPAASGGWNCGSMGDSMVFAEGYFRRWATSRMRLSARW
jgi:hypothetical protein